MCDAAQRCGSWGGGSVSVRKGLRGSDPGLGAGLRMRVLCVRQL